MNQIMKESNCGNKRFYKCVVENEKCINCKKSYPKKVIVGEKIEAKCWECGKYGMGVVQHVWRDDGTYQVYCLGCVSNGEATDDVFQRFRGEDIWFEGDKHCEHDEITEKMNALVEEIANLPKEQLKTFLRDIHSTIER